MTESADKLPISAFLVTCNEATYIAEVLDALQDFAEIILVDSGSTDGTQEIAKTKGARVVHQDWLGFAKQKNFAMSLCQYDWVVNVDGDEILSPDVIRHIRKLYEQGDDIAMRLYFEDIFWGEPMSPHSGKRSIVRVFRRTQAQYPLDRKVHENLIISKGVSTVKVQGLVTHFGYGTTELLMQKKNKYSSLKALEKFEKCKKPSLIKLCCIFPLTFIKSYFLQRMFLSGKRGLVHAHIEAMYAFLKEAKLFEYQQLATKQHVDTLKKG
jgi:glycosyltransferase involved in cell wall biosynthesis